MRNSNPPEAKDSGQPDSVNIVGLEVDVVGPGEAVARIEGLSARGGGTVCFATVHMVMEAYDDPDFSKIVNSAELVVPDGMPLVWMQKMLGRSESTRARGNSVMVESLRRAAETGLRVGFYGATQAVLDKVRERAETEFPSLSISYTYSPPFRVLSPEEDGEVVGAINRADLDILFVGLGCPKQETWMASHRERLSCVMLGVGAAFDFFARVIPECPQWLSGLGLEWLYRLSREPKRLWRRYLSTNPRFVFLAIRQLMRTNATAK